MTSIAQPTIARPTPAPHAGLRSATGYWLAGIVAIVGLVAGIAFGINSYRGSQRHLDTFARVSIPGAMIVPIDQAGGRVVYYEGADKVRFGDLKISVTDPAGGPVAVNRYDGEMIYETLNLTQGRAVATFNAAQEGAYHVAVSGVSTGQLTVGDSFSRRALPGILAALGIIALGLAAGFVLWLVTFLKRSERRRTSRPSASAGT